LALSVWDWSRLQQHRAAMTVYVQHVLQDQPHHYRKGASVARIKPLFGEGLTTSKGALWRRLRQLMRPIFQ
jgi:cytochrome P450